MAIQGWPNRSVTALCLPLDKVASMLTPHRIVARLVFAVLAKLLRYLAAVLLSLSLLACTPSLDLKGMDISDKAMGGDFTLTDHTGQARSLAGFKGKAVALFFGYTHCPDVCPTTMLEYAEAMKVLGAEADKVQVLFVSVDPQRDTRQVLAGYVPHFDPRFLGLTGSAAAIDKVKAQYQIVAQKVPASGGSYTVDHSAGSYLFDRQGKLRVYEAYGTPSTVLAHDLRELLR